MQFGALCQIVFAPDPLVQFGHNRCSLSNPGAHLCIKVQSAGDCGARVSEVVHHFKSVTVDGDAW